MEDISVVLTETDKAILESYKHFCEGLSDYIGDGYEIVLHSLETLDHSVIKIIHGNYTGRTEGAPITDLALTMLADLKADPGKGYVTYLSRNKKGEPLKSSTITIRGENGRIVGLMCINFFLNTPFISVINNFSQNKTYAEQHHESESFVDNVNELILATIADVRSKVENDPAVSAATKNKEIVAELMERGIFNLKDAVVKSAEILGVSKNTIYMHLRNLSK